MAFNIIALNIMTFSTISLIIIKHHKMTLSIMILKIITLGIIKKRNHNAESPFVLLIKHNRTTN
jgi:hypothetical protein